MLTQIYGVTGLQWVNTLRPRQSGRRFADDIFKCISSNEAVWILIKISFSLKLVPKGLINNTSALVELMAWRRPGDKPLSEPMMVSLPTHICVTRPQWVNITSYFSIPELICVMKPLIQFLHYQYIRPLLPTAKLTSRCLWLIYKGIWHFKISDRNIHKVCYSL